MLRFQLLGPLEVRDGEQALGVRRRKQRALLAILALYVEGYIRSERETSAGEPQKIANSDVAAQKLRSSLGTIKEEVHEATR